MFSANKKIATANSYDIGFVLTSSNENVIKINADDDFEIIGKGSSIITIKTVDGRWSYSWKVTVSDKQTSFSKYVTGFTTGKDIDEAFEKDGWVTKL